MNALPFGSLSISSRHDVRHSAGVTDEAFLDLAQGDAVRSGSVLLQSGGAGPSACWSACASSPLVVLRTRGFDATIEMEGRSHGFHGHPLDALRWLLQSVKRASPQENGAFSAGLYGYLAYDLKNTLERLPDTVDDPYGLPDMYFVLPSRVLVYDRMAGRVHSVLTEARADGTPVAAMRGEAEPADPPLPGPPRATTPEQAYVDAVSRVREYILAGEVYQVNLSQRFSFDLQGSPFLLWRELYRGQPAPFHAYVQAGSHQVLCASMERFLLVEGRRIATRPIKGTRPRGHDAAEDERLRGDLLSSVKDAAELAMIVDLLRNDIGKVCEAGSVTVPEHRTIEIYPSVFHSVSAVEGTLRHGTATTDVLRAVFPGGSVTGCPKIRAMEIIDELEPVRRHVYTGSIGYIGLDGRMDFNIAIRTALAHGGQLHAGVGGGIVFDSDPREEYLETLHKARGFFALAGPGGDIEEGRQ